MNSPEFKNTVCRICLDENVALDWNNPLIEHSDISYKDCYYKYTQLKPFDDDPLSSMLCENCSNCLEDVHSLIMKALDSHNFLLEVNCVKIDAENSIIEEESENCASTDFETVLVEKPEPESSILQQFEYESFDESTAKSENDDLNISEQPVELQYPEIIEIEEQDEFDANECSENVKQDVSNIYETKRKSNRISCKRKLREDISPNTKVDVENSRSSYSRLKSDRQIIEFDDKYDSDEESDGERTHGYVNTEQLQYEDILDEEGEFAGNNKSEQNRSGVDVVRVYQTKRTNSGNIMENKKNLEKDDDLNNDNSYKNSPMLKKEAQKLKLKNESNSSRTRNSTENKKNTTKTRKDSHQNSQNTPRMCSYCSKILHNKYALQKHEKTHLANRERKAPCPICGVKFLEESYVKIHMQIHNQDRVKKHKCEFCDKAFYEKGSLNVHRRIHLGQMIPCSLCSKEFFRQVDLDIHMNSHSAAVINAETKKRSRYWVRCKYCNKDIMSTSFKYHTAVHLNEPQMKCSICNREFFRRDSCTDHLKTIHKISTEEYSNYIILYNKNRLSHLYLEQTAELKK